MKEVSSVFFVLFGNIHHEYLKKGEGQDASKVLAAIQISTLIGLNLMSASFLLSSLVNSGMMQIFEASRIKVFLIMITFIGLNTFLIIKFYRWDEVQQERYFKVLRSDDSKWIKLLARIIPYITMGLFVAAMALGIALN
ncbi:hypothetical protein BTJ40_10660 [Microbulbifer sp. A4B17]|uniref:hypothetical protein n=1 Tax=Microbulbifer sp. A4B17 TaxID=359370 RepID=UPI000D52B751|nr:hypothetical protein [Microbulbifer sp. A4B17]AWF81243.1 hypothetical protein BTJ40_10660 [Microbulbifer sp. A4B17]